MDMKQLREIGKMDPEYSALEVRFRKLHTEMEKMAATLSEKQQNLLWDYVCTSDAMDHRLLEIACQRIRQK